MKIIFWGTPQYSVPTLNAIVNSNHEILSVVTQPDRKRRRGGKLDPSPVKKRSLELKLPTITPENIKNDIEVQEQIKALDADVYIVVAFGQILPKSLLDVPAYGCWNAHASSLPRWRGAAPIQWSILEGDTKTGVCIMAMNEGLDSGPVLLEKELDIGLKDNAIILASRLSTISAELIINTLSIIDGKLNNQTSSIRDLLDLREQDRYGNDIKYARSIKKEDLLIDWHQSSLNIHRRIMAFHPNSYTFYKGKRLKILDSLPITNDIPEIYLKPNMRNKDYKVSNTRPGTIIGIDKDSGIFISTSDYPLLVLKAQLQSKNKAEGMQLIQLLKPNIGDTLLNQ